MEEGVQVVQGMDCGDTQMHPQISFLGRTYCPAAGRVSSFWQLQRLPQLQKATLPRAAYV